VEGSDSRITAYASSMPSKLFETQFKPSKVNNTVARVPEGKSRKSLKDLVSSHTRREIAKTPSGSIGSFVL